MSAAGPDCRHARLHIGAAPHDLPAEVSAHLANCVDCSRFRDEMEMLDGRVRSALEVPLARFRERAPPARRFALAASVALAFLLAGGFWLLNPRPALASEIAEHLVHEPGSWDMREPLSAESVAAVLRQAGVEYDVSMPVVYAMACEFRGHRVPHLVVQTPAGPLTVMLLSHETVTGRSEFSEHGYSGVLLPAGKGAVAVLSRGSPMPEDVVQGIAHSMR